MTTPSRRPASRDLTEVHLPRLLEYLRRAGWTLVDEDSRTSMWQWPRDEELRVVLPGREDVTDYADRVLEAVRTLAFAERRAWQDVVGDVEYGGADTLAVRMTPEAPSGEAPLGMAHAALTALRNLVVGSAAALDSDSLVLPPRRPQRAEGYANQARVSTAAGSFVINLSLPLLEEPASPVATEPEQDRLLEVPPQPYGRRVTLRMIAAAEHATDLARRVGAGDAPLRSFGAPEPNAANATELAALAALGGPEQERYRLRFSPSPLVPGAVAARLSVTPAEQRILGEAADFLRTKQPRSGVTVIGLVVRLFRTSPFGSGEIVIQGVDDDSGVQRRFRVDLSEGDYNEAVRAHREGLQVVASADLDVRGTRLSLRRLTSFAILPGLEDE